MQATSALLFLYREVLERPLNGIRIDLRGRAPTRLPVYPTKDRFGKPLPALKFYCRPSAH